MIFLITRKKPATYGENQAVVVRAKDKADALKIAAANHENEPPEEWAKDKVTILPVAPRGPTLLLLAANRGE